MKIQLVCRSFVDVIKWASFTSSIHCSRVFPTSRSQIPKIRWTKKQQRSCRRTGGSSSRTSSGRCGADTWAPPTSSAVWNSPAPAGPHIRECIYRLHALRCTDRHTDRRAAGGGRVSAGGLLRNRLGKAGQWLLLREFSRILPLCWYPLFIFAEIHMLTYPPTHRHEPRARQADATETYSDHFTSLVFHYEGLRTDFVWASATGNLPCVAHIQLCLVVTNFYVCKKKKDVYSIASDQFW